MRRALDFEVEGQSKKGRQKKTWKSRQRKCEGWLEMRRCSLQFKVECWC